MQRLLQKVFIGSTAQPLLERERTGPEMHHKTFPSVEPAERWSETDTDLHAVAVISLRVGGEPYGKFWEAMTKLSFKQCNAA